ncbi:hypothetical protein Skr01_52920 [Sphaerisporangium krabiense]|uniref:DUF397 domain-containing protein n=2 Tax=Sphaerisporangium krabiense TaxID=763782 RepID=A0A7W9DQH7_9ACTN|nr:hypothetical protein [Sphaerisporangium krabiense]GII65207.1 hypothetical protein Skr01_52920 [Sphaerisporangium krabiense]
MDDKLRFHGQWRKSSHSNNGGDCVEVCIARGASRASYGGGEKSLYLVRDSKDPHGRILAFTHTGWGAFRIALKNGAL